MAQQNHIKDPIPNVIVLVNVPPMTAAEIRQLMEGIAAGQI